MPDEIDARRGISGNAIVRLAVRRGQEARELLSSAPPVVDIDRSTSVVVVVAPGVKNT